MIRQLALAAAIGCLSMSYAQLKIDKNPPQDSLKYFLKGLGVIVSNIKISGSTEALGLFEGFSELPIYEGIVLSTGKVEGVAGIAGITDTSNLQSTNLNFPGTSILNVPSHNCFDAISLEFDVLPFGDTLSFSFCFGSEEYPKFAPPYETKYNDNFGVFISGPTINGVKNCAVLPDSTTISINSINPITNPSYYINNINGKYNAFNGLTQLITIKEPVLIGAKYHFTIALQDVGDEHYDSGVFIKAHSLKSNGSEVNVQNQNNSTITIGPNPSDDFLSVYFSDVECTVQIYALTGALIHTMENVKSGDKLDICSIPSGTYLLKTKIGNQTLTNKWVKK